MLFILHDQIRSIPLSTPDSSAFLQVQLLIFKKKIVPFRMVIHLLPLICYRAQITNFSMF